VDEGLLTDLAAIGPLALDILDKEPGLPAVYVKYGLSTMQNVNDYCPNDPAVELPSFN